MMAANRVGKTESVGAYEITCHLTGIYPEWWVGRKFTKPVNILVAGETGKLVRDSIQKKLFGPPLDRGTGMIPADRIVGVRPKSGIPDAIDTGNIRGEYGESIIQFQSYDQGRTAFQATERDVVWLDEEPPIEVYSECLIRTMTTNGLVLSTFTPLKGVSDTVISLQEKADQGIAHITYATWDDAPHLSEKDKEELLAGLPVHQRAARSKGIPALGSGAVFPIDEEDIKCAPFEIPPHFKRLYGMDVGWNATAAAWGAYDGDADIIYIYDAYKMGQREPAVHSSAIKARGEWIKGKIDPASRGRSQTDGKQLLKLYKDQGLDIDDALNAVEAGVFNLYERLSTGRLKVFETCAPFFEEYRMYRRDEKGKIVKKNDHIMDAARYMGMSIVKDGVVFLSKKPEKIDPFKYIGNAGFMG